MTTPYLVYGAVITVIKRTLSGQDERGNDTYSESSFSVSGCSVQPAASAESTDFADQLTTSITVFAPWGTNVGYLDAIVVNGLTYEVDGVPDVWQSPFSGNTAPVRIDATLVEGAT